MKEIIMKTRNRQHHASLCCVLSSRSSGTIRKSKRQWTFCNHLFIIQHKQQQQQQQHHHPPARLKIPSLPIIISMASDSITARREYDNSNTNNNSRRRLGGWTSGMMNAMNAARRRHRRNNNNNNNNNSRSSGSSNNTRQRLLLVWNIWTLLGLCSYGLIWIIMMSDTQQHYEHVVLRNQQQEVIQKALDLSRLERRLDHNNKNNKQRGHASSLRKSQPQQQQQQTEGATSTKYDSASSTGGNDSSSSSQQQQQQQPQDDNDDFPFLGLWASMFILSYYRIRMEPHLRQYRSQQQQQQQRELRRRTGTAANLNPSEQQEAVVRTLRRINQEREARGQESISLESYRAFQHVLMTDRSIWRVLAQRPQQAQPQSQRRPVAATAEQLEACPIRTLERPEDTCVISAGGDCTICLGSYETKDRIRTLPCRHEFHVDCIDRWMQQSVLCPICKASLAPEEEETNNNNNNNATNDNNDNDNVVWAEIPGRMNNII